MRHHFKGFSLLELLVVIVIIAILFTFTTLSIRPDDPVSLIRTEAQRFDRLLTLLLEEAILRGEELGIEFQPKQYRFVRIVEGEWLPIEDDRILRTRELPRELELELVVEQTDVVMQTSDDASDKASPQVFALSSGEITPEFSVSFFIPTLLTRYTVEGRFDGSHLLQVDE